MNRGYGYALLAAAGFGLSVPFSKLLLDTVPPVTLAGLLYLGAAAALLAFKAGQKLLRLDTGRSEAPLRRADFPWLLITLIAGGTAAPVLLLVGLQHTPAATASLLLTLETVFTIAVARLWFGESLSPRMVAGVPLIAGAAVLLSVYGTSGWGLSLGALGVVGATLCWALDNNATSKISLRDPAIIVCLKGLAGGSVSIALGHVVGEAWPDWSHVAGSLVVGGFGYGFSLVFFILALRGIGAARTASLFGAAPFIGVVASVAIFAESRSLVLVPAALATGLGIWLLVGEKRDQWHVHGKLVHEHRHVHDEHHGHEHEPGDVHEPHSHVHVHEPLGHSHVETPDIHHRKR